MTDEQIEKKRKVRMLANGLIGLGFVILMIGFIGSLTTGVYDEVSFGAGLFNMAVGSLIRWRNR